MILIVGAGLSGATLARQYAEMGKQVLVIDKRSHIAGNTHDFIDAATGIRLSTYGAHIFHTDHEDVWEFVNKYSQWTPYEHRVKSMVNGKIVPVPVNIDTVNQLFGLSIINETEMQAWLDMVQVKGEVNNSKDAALARVGKAVYELMFENYTKKQWDMYPEQLEPSVLERIPVRTDFNDRYFSNKYEALPTNGYTEFVQGILDHPNITVQLNTEYNPDMIAQSELIFFTGKVDSYFNHQFGKLEYRSINFDYKVYDQASYQSAAVVNYPSLDYPFTRKIEYKKFYNTESPMTIVAEEYSSDTGEEYYPVPTQRNRDIYKLYQQEAQKLEPFGIYFVGRLAEYKYFNMDQAIKSALDLFNRLNG